MKLPVPAVYMRQEDDYIQPSELDGWFCAGPRSFCGPRERDIKPRMEDMWVAARREPQVCSTEGWNTEGLLAPPSEGVEF